MPQKAGLKCTIGKEDAGSPGTPVTRTATLPIRDIGTLDRSILKLQDPLIAGLSMPVGESAVAGDVKGNIPLSPRCCTGMGHILKGLLDTEDTPAHIVGAIRIRYTGASASNKITTNLAAKTIESKIGALGAESVDAAFGTAGVIDLTAAGFDTLAELVAAIDGYTDYSASLVTGTGSNCIVSVVTTIEQGKGREVFLFLTGVGTNAYLHRFVPNLTLYSERNPYSIQLDGRQDNYLYDGCVIDVLNLSAQLKSFVEGSIDVLGMHETNGQVASVLTPPSHKPFLFGGGFTGIGGVQYNFVRKHSLKLGNSHLAEGYGQASVDRAYHQRGMFLCEAGMTLRLDAVSVAERPKCELGTQLAVQFMYFEAESPFLLGVKGFMLIEYNKAEISENPSYEVNGEQIDLGLKVKAFNPGQATDYDDPVVIAILTEDVGAY